VLVKMAMGSTPYMITLKNKRRSNGYIALQKARHRFNPVTYQELMDITGIWVDAALQLNARDLKVMDRFVRSQQKLFKEYSVATKHEPDMACSL
jgi:DSF synthase